MKKDFKGWNEKKIGINQISRVPFFHEREIWFVSLGVNVGLEQDGSEHDFQRPVLIVKKFNNDICWVIPLSRTKRRGPYYHAFSFEADFESVALLSQFKLLDARRLSRKIGVIRENDFRDVIKKLMGLFPMSFFYCSSVLRQSRAEAVCPHIISSR
jgi:mRNA interferase MazF